MYVGAVAERTPEKPAFIHCGETETVVTFGELDQRSSMLAAYLRGIGLQPGDGIAVITGNHISTPEIYWAAQRSGLYYTPVNTYLSVEEARHVVADCGARVVIAASTHLDLADAATANLPMLARLAVDGFREGFLPYEAELDGTLGLPHEQETEGSAFLYSSGTTGRPKGIKRVRSGRPPGGTLFGMDPSIARAYGLTRESVALIPLPLYHSSGLTRFMLSTSLGCTTVLMQRFDANRALEVMERLGVTDSLWVATMFVRMLQLPEDVRLSFDLSAHRHATVGSGPCPAHVKEQMIGWWGPIITEIYGGTEGNGMTRITSVEWLEHKGSVGRPVFGDVHIVDDDGNELPAGEVGTIYFSGGRSFEYHNIDPGPEDVFKNRGWSSLGDIGWVDDDDYLYIVDRKSDMIIVGGVNISPLKIEEVLIMHPTVRDVAVVGVPDNEYGEVIKAVIEPKEGVIVSAQLEAELIEYSSHHLPKIMIPRSVDFDPELPRHPTGKLYKRSVRARYWPDSKIKV